MELQVSGEVPAAPFLSARDRFETECDLERPVRVRVRPGERTRVNHTMDGHVLTLSERAATSAMAGEIAVHEFAHMRRHEEAHPSHVLPTEEALFLAFAGREVERRVLAHCYQIANHVRDVYADDITVRVGDTRRLAAFLESELAAAVADGPGEPSGDPGRVAGGPPTATDGGGATVAQRVRPAADPAITAVNAAFALALLERHDAVGPDHPIYDLAHAAATDAPAVDLAAFRERFRTLSRDPDESDHRRALVGLLDAYADSQAGGAAVVGGDRDGSDGEGCDPDGGDGDVAAD